MISRRSFLSLAAAAVPPAPKPLRGIFPIAQSPFTEANELDLDALARQVRFLDRCGAHGIVWPQLASEWDTLSAAERSAGAETIARTAKGLRLAVVLGVQSPDPDQAVAYARQAERLAAGAIISLPPGGDDAQATLNYYRRIGSVTALPLIAQAVGKMSPELILEMHRAVPSLRYVKDEAGQPLDRIATLTEGSRGELKVFSGAHGRTLIEEMRRGFSGSMPAAAFADLYAQTWNLWQAGRRRRQAMEMHARTLLVLTDMGLYGIEGLKYPLVLRGVFSTWKARKRESSRPLDESARQALKEALDFARPYLKAS